LAFVPLSLPVSRAACAGKLLANHFVGLLALFTSSYSVYAS
jgi:hypothetical protein